MVVLVLGEASPGSCPSRLALARGRLVESPPGRSRVLPGYPKSDKRTRSNEIRKIKKPKQYNSYDRQDNAHSIRSVRAITAGQVRTRRIAMSTLEEA